MPFNQRLIEKANKLGFKTANLDELSGIIKEISNNQNFKIEIPPFKGLEDEIIKSHLDKHTNGQWRLIWEEFTKTFNSQRDQTTLDNQSLSILENLSNMIKDCFNKHPLSKDQLSDILGNLSPTDLLMVRSTGKEDSTEQANPGGNDSIACVEQTPEAISTAIGKVIASYVGEKSLSQRLKAKDNITQDIPFIPILIQKMIGEKINNNEKANIYSGVIYTSDGCTNIQMAPGHGELIVNSKGNFDNIYISQDGMIYFENMQKRYRLAPVTDKDDPKKIKLEMIANDPDTRNNASADRELAGYLHKVSKLIEKKYGMRMDIEFIYDAENKKLSIVQARPIPLGDRRNLQPSSISPKHIAVIQKNNKVQKANVITPDTLRAAVIQNKSQVLIYQTIGEALDAYLKMGENHSNIKAVIIKEPSASNSHEAGEFSSKAIPVLQAIDYNTAVEMVDSLSENKALVIDPQRKFFVMLEEKNEDNLYEMGVLENGIFRTPLSPYVSPINFDFSKSKLENSSPQDFAKVMEEFSKNQFYFNDFVSASENNQISIDKLSSYLHGILNLTNGKINTKQAIDKLDTIANISFNGENNSNNEQKNAISTVLRYVSLVSRNLNDLTIFKQIMITGGELYLLLNRAGNMPYSEKLLIEYLNVYEKFSGLITAYGKTDTLSHSLINELSEKHLEENFKKSRGTENTPINNKELYLVQVSKFEKYLLNSPSKLIWKKFTKDCGNLHINDLKSLSTMLAWLESSGITANWINTSFIKSYQKYEGNIVKVISEQLKECGEYRKNSQDFEKVSMILMEMNNQVSLFKEPDKFDKLFDDLNDKMSQLSKILQYKETDSEIKKAFLLKSLHQLVDILDRSIKSLEKSTQYQDQDKKLQENRFYKMLRIDLDLMNNWVKIAGFKNQFNINDAIKGKAKPEDRRIDELSPTPLFSTEIYNIVSTKNECSPNFNHGNVTLEDLFTLTHQNLLLSIGALSKKTGIQHEQLPDLLKTFDDKLAKDSCLCDSEYSRCDLISSDFSSPYMSMHYNMPLASHSVSITLRYNMNDKIAQISCSFIGEDDSMRWEKLPIEALMIGMMTNQNIKLSPKCSERFFAFDLDIEDINKTDFVRSLIIYCARRTREPNEIFHTNDYDDPSHPRYIPNAFTGENLNIIRQDLLSMQEGKFKKNDPSKTDNTNDSIEKLKEKYSTEIEKIALAMNSIYHSIRPAQSHLFKSKELIDLRDHKSAVIKAESIRPEHK